MLSWERQLGSLDSAVESHVQVFPAGEMFTVSPPGSPKFDFNRSKALQTFETLETSVRQLTPTRAQAGAPMEKEGPMETAPSLQWGMNGCQVSCCTASVLYMCVSTYLFVCFQGQFGDHLRSSSHTAQPPTPKRGPGCGSENNGLKLEAEREFWSHSQCFTGQRTSDQCWSDLSAVQIESTCTRKQIRASEEVTLSQTGSHGVLLQKTNGR